MKKFGAVCLVFCLLMALLAGCVSPPVETQPKDLSLSAIPVTGAVAATESAVTLQMSAQAQIDPERVLLVQSAEPVLFETPGATVSVDQFGAVAGDDGNDAIAIQEALDHVKNGGTVYFPAGTYHVEKTLLF